MLDMKIQVDNSYKKMDFLMKNLRRSESRKKRINAILDFYILIKLVS